MEKNYWQIDDILYKVYISADMFEELKDDYRIEDMAKYIKDGVIYAYDIVVEKSKLKKVLTRLEEFNC